MPLSLILSLFKRLSLQNDIRVPSQHKSVLNRLKMRHRGY